MVKSLIFDYGGTLDTDGLHWSHVLWEAYTRTAAQLPQARGLGEITWEAFRAAYVYGERTLGQRPIVQPDDDFHTVLLRKVDLETQYLQEQGLWTVPEPDRRTVIAALSDYCNRYVLRRMETSRRLLQHFSGKYNLVLVSNFYGNVRAVLRSYGLTCFGAVIESAEVGIRKPDPAIWQLGIEAAGTPAAQCAVIGDSFGKDIRPAHSLGCETVWLKGRGWDREEADESLPTHVIHTLRELADIY